MQPVGFKKLLSILRLFCRKFSDWVAILAVKVVDDFILAGLTRLSKWFENQIIFDYTVKKFTINPGSFGFMIYCLIRMKTGLLTLKEIKGLRHCSCKEETECILFTRRNSILALFCHHFLFFCFFLHFLFSTRQNIYFFILFCFSRFSFMCGSPLFWQKPFHFPLFIWYSSPLNISLQNKYLYTWCLQ